MSLSREITIWCDADGCLELEGEFPDQNPSDVRDVLLKKGWRCDGDGDFCPEHAAQAEKADHGSGAT